jgi:cytochrome c biogenesis protein CcdA
MFRRYVDTRLGVYEKILDRKAAESELAQADKQQREIWSHAQALYSGDHWAPAALLVLPSINAMIDATTGRTLILQTHNPGVVTALLIFLAAFSSVVAGYSMSVRKSRSLLYVFMYALSITLAILTVIALDYPRAALIHLEASDQVLIQLRNQMK